MTKLEALSFYLLFDIIMNRGDYMKLVVFSDVHGNKFLLERIIEFNPDADAFLSLGDSELSQDYLQDLDIIGVKGNYPRDPGIGYEHTMVLKGKKFFLTHGHKYGVHRSMKKLAKKAIQDDIDVVLYGHTHIAQALYCDQILLLNPGSVNRSRNVENPSYCIMHISNDGKITYEFRESETNMEIDIKIIKERLK